MSILSSINKNWGILLFKNPNTLTYGIFNFLYDKYVVNLNNINNDIRFFHERGYLKPDLNFKAEVIDLVESLDETKPINESCYNYVLNEKSIKKIKDI